jgi:PAS domain S-box-containing protein
MPDENISKRLQKTIVAYSAVGMFVVGVAVALVGVLPLARNLRDAHQQNLLVTLQRHTTAVEQYVSRIKGLASIYSSRTQLREHFEAYLRGTASKDSLLPDLERLLREPRGFSTNLIGIAIVGAQSNVVLETGHRLPIDAIEWPEPNSREGTLAGPVRLADETAVVCAANIFGSDQSRLGVAVTLFRTTMLQQIVEDYTGLGATGELTLGSRQNKALPIFFPMRATRQGRQPDPKRIAAVMEGLQRAHERRTELFAPSPPMDEQAILAHGPVKGSDWGAIVSMNRRELLSGMNRQLTLLGSLLVLLILLGAVGMVFVLRPLAGRVILHTDELESQIYEKTAALNTELAERKRAEQSLRDSEALYHSLVDTLPINILRKDKLGRVTYGNRGYCDRMGKPLSELLGKTDYQLFPRELADKYCRDDEKVVRTGEMFEDIEEHRTGDGNRLYVHVLKAPVRDAQKNVVGTQVIFWDVTARKLAEEALEKAAAELARSNKELEQFAYVASHDLQEPLRMVTSYTQLIARRYQDRLDQDAQDFMQFAVDGAMRMQKLLQGLLEYSRVGTRGKPFEPTACDAILDAAIANLKLAFEETGARLVRDPRPTVMGDTVQLIQLFQNLIGNALKFRHDTTPEVRIGAERRPKADAASLGMPPYEWVFHVRDNGIGIEPQYFERIFVIFQRLHTQDQYPGTGIGLAICRKIVERHGGKIWLESETKKGTCFYFALPALD